MQVKDGCEEKTYIIDHDDAGIQASDRIGNQVDCLFRAVRTGNFQEFIIKKLSGFTNLPPFLVGQIADQLTLSRTGAADNDQ